MKTDRKVMQMALDALEAAPKSYQAPDTQAALREALARPVTEAARWWSLVMGAAASIEDAANCLRDEDAKREAIGAAKYYRGQANALRTAPAPQAKSRCSLCRYEHGHAIGCENNPVDIALRAKP